MVRAWSLWEGTRFFIILYNEITMKYTIDKTIVIFILFIVTGSYATIRVLMELYAEFENVGAFVLIRPVQFLIMLEHPDIIIAFVFALIMMVLLHITTE